MRLEGLNKTFGEQHVLKDINLELPERKTTVIVGPSGSGKSTLLRSLNLLERPESGQYQLAELEIDFAQKISAKQVLNLRKKTGMVFQDYNLFPHKTVLQNVVEGPVQVLKQPKKQAEQEALELLDKVGLKNKAATYPEQLSGGQAQRVAIARSLAMHPEYILLDEPTSALDPELEAEVLKVLADLAREKQSLVIVTHNLFFARQIADKIVFVEDGRIIFDGEPERFFNEEQENARIRNFISAMTFSDLEAKALK
ncbi:amino acid ABC transporter ATP-binding protein [Ligilactobacillus salitolerans]|uniref:Amino acid ABC transporter ATP-binding protein n=1 Tax=Ligilactobacillus salitolerans TaxID=1808352 RepID=A0A401IW15_9LACO|nr:amino acid ABC transporter ATP-binding protein [Ligilactobacillus salitolerans]GBG95743.1 amino acid ABC transporter ATP-binding protein [Ligilactobacillus salitolerans]